MGILSGGPTPSPAMYRGRAEQRETQAFGPWDAFVACRTSRSRKCQHSPRGPTSAEAQGIEQVDHDVLHGQLSQSAEALQVVPLSDERSDALDPVRWPCGNLMCDEIAVARCTSCGRTYRQEHLRLPDKSDSCFVRSGDFENDAAADKLSAQDGAAGAAAHGRQLARR